MLNVLNLFRWIALIAAAVFVIAMAAAILSSQKSIQPSQQQTTEKNSKETYPKEKEVALFDRWFPDSTAVFNLFLMIFTGVLAFSALIQLNLLTRAEHIAKDTAQAAKDSADVARQGLIISQRPYVRSSGFPWLWRPDLDRPGKYFFEITPIIENVGNTPATASVVVDHALRDTPLPDGFDFPYPSPAGNTVISARQSVGMNNAIILDTDLLAVKEGKKFFYIWGTVIYPDGFQGTPIHTTEFCAQIGRVIGNPLDPRDPSNPKGTSVEISFLVYREHNKAD